MKKEIQQADPNVLLKFAHLLGTEVKDGRLEIPPKYGRGYCTGYVFNEQIRILITNYKLNVDLTIENPDVNIPMRMILFKFQNIIPWLEIPSTDMPIKTVPSVLITTSAMNTDIIIPIDRNTAAINIEMDADYLSQLFDCSGQSMILKSLLENTQPLLFEQILYPSLLKIINEMMTEAVNTTFKRYFIRIKTEELVCRLLMELEKREEKQIYALNSHDTKSIYQIKERILHHLDTPPVIKELAISVHMSPSKLKRLFKQIFGNSIFNYYQDFRMKEAARLLKEEKLSVSEVGYQLGFTNLSHFSRIFKKHIGMNPKQYTKY